MLLALAFWALPALDCVVEFGKLGRRQIIKSVKIEHDELSTSEVHFWRIDGQSGDSGLVTFEIVSASPARETFIKLNEIWGVDGAPGVGQILLREVRRTYPDLRIDAFMDGTNRARILKAIEENPQDPDFSNVPSISALNEPYELKFHYLNVLAGDKPLALIELRRLPQKSTEPIWLNRRAFLSEPAYKTWLRAGRPQIETVFGKKTGGSKAASR